MTRCGIIERKKGWVGVKSCYYKVFYSSYAKQFASSIVLFMKDDRMYFTCVYSCIYCHVINK